MINLWGLILTLAIFYLSLQLKSTKILNGFFRKIPPTVTTGIFLIGIIYFFKLDYTKYNESACWLTILLGPATIALAYPLVDNLYLLNHNKRAVYFGLVIAYNAVPFHQWQSILLLLFRAVLRRIRACAVGFYRLAALRAWGRLKSICFA